MTERASLSREVERLLADLQSASGVRRDAAVARLRVIGARAVARLTALVRSTVASAETRALALSALEGIDDGRASDAALAALASEREEVVVAALGVLRRWVEREPGTRVLDAITGIATDTGRSARVRAAAADALSDLPPDLVRPVLDQAPPRRDALSFDDPALVHDWIGAHGAGATLSELHTVVKTTREREAAEPAGVRRQHWLGARGAAHAALARRDSRVALYDLREAFETATAPLPIDFLTAAAAIGDAACLEPMARAWAALPRETWWRDRLTAAARAIVQRLSLTGRHAVVKRLRANAPGFLN